MNSIWQKIVSIFMSIIAFFGSLFGISKPIDPTAPTEVTTTEEMPTEPTTEDDRLPTLADTSFKGYSFEQMEPENSKVTFERIIMQNEEQKQHGTSGFGCQWPTALANSADGSLMFYGIDVAGVYVSKDHGLNWEMANQGLHDRAVTMIAVDPKNSNHIVMLANKIYYSLDGANNWQLEKNNLPSGYSVDTPRYSWKGLCFDGTSFDEEQGISTIAYMSTPYLRDTGLRGDPTALNRKTNALPANLAGLYKSTDGGKTFDVYINDIRLADGIVKVTDNGRVFVASPWGLFEISESNGEPVVTVCEKFYNQVLYNYDTSLENEEVIDPENYVTCSESIYYRTGNKVAEYKNVYNLYLGVTGLDVNGNTLYVQDWKGIYTFNAGESISIANEESFDKITDDETYPVDKWAQYVEVSQSNPKHIVFQYRGYSLHNAFVNITYTSFDGGKTWNAAVADPTTFFQIGMNFNSRERCYIIDPSDDNRVVTFSGDNPAVSTDGGLNFSQASGVSNMLGGGKVCFNYYDPDLIFIPAQDYTGVVSTDGGETYRQFKVPGYGNMYGGFASDTNTFYGFVSKGWGGPYYLAVSHNAGADWTIYDEYNPERTLSTKKRYSMQSYTNPNILFAGGYYSKDNGYTWEKMNGSEWVATISYGKDHELYGVNAEEHIVVSYDNGDTWEEITTDFIVTKHKDRDNYMEEIREMAFDQVNRKLYAVVFLQFRADTGKTLSATEVYCIDLENNNEATRLYYPIDNSQGYGYSSIQSIAIDPNSTNVIYLAGSGAYYLSETSLLRSVDGGKSFHVLSSNNSVIPEFKSLAANQGGFEVSGVSVDPGTGVLYASESCYGFETCKPPYDNSKLISKNKDVVHTVSYVYDGKVIHTSEVKNYRQAEKYEYSTADKNFVCWCVDEELTTPFDEGSRITNSMYLYAKLESN